MTVNIQIDDLKSSNNYLLKLIGNQTTTQDLTTNIMKRQEQGITKFCT